MIKKIIITILLVVFIAGPFVKMALDVAYHKGYEDGYDYSFARWDAAWQSGYNYAKEEMSE